VTYTIEGELDRLRIPPLRAPRRTEGLWRHTCCEMFVARPGLPAYHEFNFAPSGEWTAYAFGADRSGDVLADEALNPQVTVRGTPAKMELEAMVRLDLLSPAHAGARLKLGLSVVVEDAAGAISYWALTHAPGTPDFHHADAFALELDEVRY
jgi:hypothetical protein